MYIRVLHILANFELTLAWVKSVCGMGQLEHMELAEWLVHWAPKLASRVRCSTRSSS